MKSELIFRGSGLLGSNYLLIKKKKKIYNFKNSTNAINSKNIKISLKQLEKFIKEKKINLVLNFAAITNIEECEKKKKSAYYTNVKLPTILSKITKKLKIKFVHISTDHFLSEKLPITEKSTIQTCNYYAYTKLMAEKILLNITRKRLY